MKKIMIAILSSFLVFLNITCVFAENTIFKPRNSTMYSLYTQKLEEKGNIRLLSDTTEMIDVKDFLSSENYDSFKALLNSNMPSTDIHIDEISTDKITVNNQDVASSIVVNNSNGTLIYMEILENEDYILFSVNGEMYKIYQDGQNLKAESSDGKTMYLLKSEDTTVLNLSQARISSKANSPYTTSQDSLYVKDVGPMSKTNKELVYITGLIGEVGQTLAEYGIMSPTLGTASIILQIGVSLYDNFQVTYYIRYWHSYKKADTSSWRSKNRYFSDSEYNNWFKDFTTYFETTQP